MKNKLSLKCKGIFVLLLLLGSSIGAHDNKVVHPYVLSGRAKDLLYQGTGEENSPYLELISNFNEDESGKPADKRSKILKGTLGTIEADEPVTKCFNHFYNPITYQGGAGILGGNDAISYGKTFWETAITDYNDGSDESKQTSYRNLGNVLHLLQDMTSVPHVYNDAHVPPYLFWGITNSYEDWVADYVAKSTGVIWSGGDIKQASGSAYPLGTSDLSYDDFLHEVADKTFDSVKVREAFQRIKF